MLQDGVQGINVKNTSRNLSERFDFEQSIDALTCMLWRLLHQCIDSQFEDLQPPVRETRSCEEPQGSQPSSGIPLRSEKFRWGTPNFFRSNPQSSPNTRLHSARRPHCGRWCRSRHRSRTWLPSRTPPSLLECLEAPSAEGSCRLPLPRCCPVASWIDHSLQLMQTETHPKTHQQEFIKPIYLFVALENKCWLSVYKSNLECLILQGRKKGLHKILKTTSIDAFCSESEEDLLHSNKPTHHYFKWRHLGRSWNFQRKQHIFLWGTVSTRYITRRIWSFIPSRERVHIYLPSQALMHKRNLCLATEEEKFYFPVLPLRGKLVALKKSTHHQFKVLVFPQGNNHIIFLLKTESTRQHENLECFLQDKGVTFSPQNNKL